MKKKIYFRQIKDWYDGYNIGKFTLFNPWSIMNCLDNLKYGLNEALQNYWVRSGNSNILEIAFKNMKDINCHK